jgi:hypothetical protein
VAGATPPPGETGFGSPAKEMFEKERKAIIPSKH